MTRSSGRGSLTTWTPSFTTDEDSMPEDAVVSSPLSSGTSAPNSLSTLPPSPAAMHTGPSGSDLIIAGVSRTFPSLEYSQTLPLWDLATMSNMRPLTYRRLIRVAIGRPGPRAAPDTPWTNGYYRRDG